MYKGAIIRHPGPCGSSCFPGFAETDPTHHGIALTAQAVGSEERRDLWRSSARELRDHPAPFRSHTSRPPDFLRKSAGKPPSMCVRVDYPKPQPPGTCKIAGISITHEKAERALPSHRCGLYRRKVPGVEVLLLHATGVEVGGVARSLPFVRLDFQAHEHLRR